jgi:tetratricopeptide (TPR) repeat protein
MLDAAASEMMPRAMEALYDLDFARARGETRRFIEAEPDNPLGYFGDAGLIWWQADAEGGGLSDRPDLASAFEADTEKCLALAAAMIESPSEQERSDGHFILGMTLGLRGQAELIRGEWMRAYSDGKKAIKHLKKCVKIAPDYHDAYLGLGIFDYQTAKLPVALKLPMLFVHRGNAERGLSRIRQASEKGRFSRDQAATFLLTLLIREGRLSEALPLLSRLRRQFPGSPYFRFREAVLLDRAGDWEGSLRSMLALLDSVPGDPSLLGRKQRTLLCGVAGGKCLDKPFAEAASRWASRALGEKACSRWSSLLYLYRGLARDILGLRVDAVNDYSKAVSEPDVPPAHEAARLCLHSACDRDAVQDILKDLCAGTLPWGPARAKP